MENGGSKFQIGDWVEFHYQRIKDGLGEIVRFYEIGEGPFVTVVFHELIDGGGWPLGPELGEGSHIKLGIDRGYKFGWNVPVDNCKLFKSVNDQLIMGA